MEQGGADKVNSRLTWARHLWRARGLTIFKCLARFKR